MTHEVEFAKKIATHVLYLEDGKVIEYGDQSIFNNPQTEKFLLRQQQFENIAENH